LLDSKRRNWLAQQQFVFGDVQSVAL